MITTIPNIKDMPQGTSYIFSWGE